MNCCEEAAIGLSPITETSGTSSTSASGSCASTRPALNRTTKATTVSREYITPHPVLAKAWTDETSTTITRRPTHRPAQTLVAWQQHWTGTRLDLRGRSHQGGDPREGSRNQSFHRLIFCPHDFQERPIHRKQDLLGPRVENRARNLRRHFAEQRAREEEVQGRDDHVNGRHGV